MRGRAWADANAKIMTPFCQPWPKAPSLGTLKRREKAVRRDGKEAMRLQANSTERAFLKLSRRPPQTGQKSI